MARWIFRITLPGFALAALAACGGGSADGGNGGGSAYSIGGTVTGLTGSGLVLHNGVEDLVVSAAGTFIFSTELASGTPYAVTVKSQPSAPAQVCMVTNGSGTVGTANIADVSVACHDATGYTVSGTVTGLTGSGLMLHNGAEDLAVSAAGTFSFSTELAAGDHYDVTVTSQPVAPAQNCVVANGSGTVGAENVGNVTVFCNASTLKFYTVGGTVTGLMGSGLVLQNNGGDDLFVTATGAFAFSTGLATELSYVVTVSTQPSAPPQKCVVTNGSGTVGTANITNVTVACAASKGYTVGGTVTGLTGSGLVLDVYAGASNPVGSLAVSAAGAFTFPVEFSQGAAYGVAVEAQPNSPGQLCIISNGDGTIGAANVTGVAVVCTTPGRFAYAANGGDNTISSYSIDPTTGALTAIGTPVATGNSPYAITGSPDRNHLYVVNQVSNDISGYTVDGTTGALTPIAGSPFAAGTDPQSLAFAPSGMYLYVANRGSDNVSAYAVDAASGALTPLPTPTYSTGPGPSAVLVEPSGRNVYVANNGGSNNVSSFTINAGTGELTPVAGSPFDVRANPHGLTFLDGILYTANFDGAKSSISTMSADMGHLRAWGSPHPLLAKNYLAVSTWHHALFVATGLGVDWYWLFDELIHIASSPGAPGANVYSVTVDPLNNFLYACNDGAANISGYTIAGGKLTPIPGSPFAAGHHPDFMAVL